VKVAGDEIWTFTYAKNKNVPAAKRKDLAYGRYVDVDRD
jgi:hypothetical protein